MTWALEEITYPISCNLCAQEFGDLQTYVCTCSLDAPAFPSADDQRESARPACSTTQTPQATLKMSGSQGSIKREGSRAWKGQGSFDEPPAEQNSEEEEPAAWRQR